MKVNTKLCQFALALLFAVSIGTASARAQKSAEEKIASPPSPPSSAQPSSLPAKRVADNLAPAGWTRYEIGEPARFTLILPAEPVARVERVAVITDVEATARNYMSVADSGVYGVSYLDALPAALLNEARKRAIFESFVKEFTESIEARMKEGGTDARLIMLEQHAASASGLAGYEQDFSCGQMKGRVRLVFDVGSAYAVVAVWNGLSSNSERNAFFESLKVNPKR